MKSFYLLGILLLLVSCRMTSEEVQNLLSVKQNGVAHVFSSFYFQNKEKVTLEFEKGGMFLWSESPSLLISGVKSSLRVNLPESFLMNLQNGAVIDSKISGVSYKIKFLREVVKTKEWTQETLSTEPMPMAVDGEGNSVSVGVYYPTQTHYYADGFTLYTMQFYNRENKLVALIKSTQSFFGVLQKSELN